MESNGREGFVTISEETKGLLMTKDPDELVFEKNTDVYIQAINQTISSYFVFENSELSDHLNA